MKASRDKVHQDIFQCQIDLPVVLAVDILPVAARSAARLSPVNSWQVGLVADSGGVVIRLGLDVTKPASTALGDGAEGTWLGPYTGGM